MPRITLEDVAKKAGVSFKTVSRVLNNEPNVSAKTAEKVRKAIAELRYVPNAAARILSSGKAMAIALVVGWPVNSPYATTLIDYTLKESLANGYSLALFTIDENVTQQIMDAYLGKRVDGIILDTNAAKNHNLMEQIHSLCVPHVIIHPDRISDHAHTSYVRIDNQLGARQAVDYLIQLGHRAIGVISYDSGLNQELDRIGGYKLALAEAGIPYREEWTYEGLALPFQIGFNGASQLLQQNKELTALFAATDEIAIGALSAIWHLGLKIPDDISVVGFDDIPYASMIAPPLTTIHQPIDEIASVAIKHLIDLIDNPDTEPINLILPTEIVIRGSCKPIDTLEPAPVN